MLGQAAGGLHHQRKAQDEEPHPLHPRQRLSLRPRPMLHPVAGGEQRLELEVGVLEVCNRRKWVSELLDQA